MRPAGGREKTPSPCEKRGRCGTIRKRSGHLPRHGRRAAVQNGLFDRGRSTRTVSGRRTIDVADVKAGGAVQTVDRNLTVIVETPNLHIGRIWNGKFSELRGGDVV